MIKVSYLRPLERAALTIPRVRLKDYVDDLQLDQEGKKEAILVDFPKAAAIILKVLK